MVEKFILDIPYLFLKKIPYAWLAVVCFWSWPPVVSGILLAIVLVGLGMMAWQNRAWEARIRREFSSGKAQLLWTTRMLRAHSRFAISCLCWRPVQAWAG